MSVLFSFVIFAHYRKWRNRWRKMSLLAIRLGAFQNTARLVCKHGTLSLEIRHAILVESVRQKVCKKAGFFTI